MQKNAILISAFDGEIHHVPVDKEILICRGDKKILGKQSGDYWEDVKDSLSKKLIIHEKIISRNHARIFFNGRNYMLADLNSKNGTFLNGERLENDKKYVLHKGDVIEFSKIKYIFEFQSSKTSENTVDEFLSMTEMINDRRKLIISINKEEIISYQREILCENSVFGLLKCNFLEENDIYKIYYDILGYESLSEIICNDDKSENELLTMLQSIIKVINILPKYLLKGENLCIELENIFVDKQTNEIKLIYVPVAERKTEDLWGRLKKIVIPCLKDTVGKEDIIRFISEEAYSITDLSKLIGKQIIGEFKEETLLENDAETEKKESSKEKKIKFKNIGKIKVSILAIQFVAIITLSGVYYTQILSGIDFVGFAIVLLAVDMWVIKTFKKEKA